MPSLSIRAGSAEGFRRRAAGSLLVAAAVAVGLLLGGLATAAFQGEDPPNAPTATVGEQRLLTPDGKDVGAVLLSSYGGRDILVIVVDEGLPGTEYTCRLRLAGGTTQNAGRWTVPESGRAVWVTPVSAAEGRVELVAAPAGQVWATAELAG